MKKHLFSCCNSFRFWFSVSCLLILSYFWSVSFAENREHGSHGKVYVLEIKNVIGPATTQYIADSFATASQDNGTRAIVLKIDTPGGLDQAMRDIVQIITKSEIPVITFVAPIGARAASAGTYIVFASHIAVMSPGSSIGAATPVTLGSRGSKENALKEHQDEKKETATSSAEIAGNQLAMHRKMVNDAVSYLQSLADLRGRDRDWAERAVLYGETLTAQEALEKNVIDYLANDLTVLLQKVDGFTVKMDASDEMMTLHLQQAEVVLLLPNWQQKLLAMLTMPQIASLFLMLGFYGLLYEMLNPGTIFPGVLGTVMLLLAFYAFQYVPINFTGLGLFILGGTLIVGEFFVPGLGILGISGVLCITLGVILLFDMPTTLPALLSGNSTYGMIFPIVCGVLLTILFFAVFWLSKRAYHLRGTLNLLSIIGEKGVALDNFDSKGLVEIHGEIWNASTKVRIVKGQIVEVVSIEGLLLEIIPVT